MLVRRLFFRVYLITVVTVAALGLIIDHWMQQDHHRQQQELRQQEFTAVFTLIELQLNSVGNHQDLLQSINQSLNLDVHLFELSELSFPENELTKLKAGNVIALGSDQQQLWFKHLSSIKRIAMISIDSESSTRFPWPIVFYLILAVPVLLVLWPLGRDLERLEQSVEAIGEQSLDQRLQLPKSSALQSINKKFNAMAERIQYLVNEQKALTSAVSHELKTPLARLKFLLASQRTAALDDATRQQLEQNITELDQLISEMLSYAKLEHLDDQLEFQSVHAMHWIQSVVEQCELPSSIEYQLNIDVNYLICDPHLMARALSNLILNAKRYAQSKLAISLFVEGNWFHIKVEDDGPGIPEQDRIRLFEPFARRESNRDKDSGGVGLGLAIVKQIIRKHQGEVNITTSSLGGACFNISFPKVDIK